MRLVETQLPLPLPKPGRLQLPGSYNTEFCEEPPSGVLFPVLAFCANSDNGKLDRRKSHFEVFVVSEQLSFDFCLEKNVTQFSIYIRKERNGLLDSDVLSFFARDPRLHKLSFTLHEVGITRIGYLVQLTRDDLKKRASASDAVVDRLERALEDAGLGLGMKTVAWRPGSGGRST